jgi:hypothetical protein
MYLPSDDIRRQIDKSNCTLDGLQYERKENRTRPSKRTYPEYVSNAMGATKKKSKNGVKGLWPLHQLPYSEDILWIKDAMHCFNNIIKDSINVLTPSNSSFSNRTESARVRNVCQSLGIHKSIHVNQGLHGPVTNHPKWVFSKKDIEEIHEDLKDVEKGCQKPFSCGGGTHSHDKLMFATLYAKSVLKNRGDEQVSNNILTLFDIITYLTNYSFKKEMIPRLVDKICSTLADREGLLPPSEATYAIHEIVHVAEQIPEAGPPMFSNLYKYERANKYLKNLIQNQKSPMSSLVKNYLVVELSSISLINSDHSLERVQDISQYTDKTMCSHIMSGYNALAKLSYDKETKILKTDHDDFIQINDPSELLVPNETLLDFVNDNGFNCNRREGSS